MRTVIRISLLSILVANTYGCSERKIFQQSSSGSESSSLEANLESSQGMKTSEQLLISFAALTGIPASNNAVNTTYVSVKSQLPYENAMSSFQASSQMAVFKLASEFCLELAKDAMKRGAFAPGLNFALAPAAAYTPAVRSAMINAFMSKFWGEGLSNSPDRSEALSTYQDLLSSLMPGAPESTTPASATGTASIFSGVCAGVLASSTPSFQ